MTKEKENYVRPAGSLRLAIEETCSNGMEYDAQTLMEMVNDWFYEEFGSTNYDFRDLSKFKKALKSLTNGREPVIENLGNGKYKFQNPKLKTKSVDLKTPNTDDLRLIIQCIDPDETADYELLENVNDCLLEQNMAKFESIDDFKKAIEPLLEDGTLIQSEQERFMLLFLEDKTKKLSDRTETVYSSKKRSIMNKDFNEDSKRSDLLNTIPSMRSYILKLEEIFKEVSDRLNFLKKSLDAIESYTRKGIENAF